MSLLISLNDLNEVTLQKLSLLHKVDPSAIPEIQESALTDLQEDLEQLEAELESLADEKKRISAAAAMYRNLSFSDQKTVPKSTQELFWRAASREKSLRGEIIDKQYQIKQRRKLLGGQTPASTFSSFWNAKIDGLISDRVPRVLQPKVVLESVLENVIQCESLSPLLVVIDSCSVFSNSSRLTEEGYQNRIIRFQALLTDLEGTRFLLLGENQRYSLELTTLLIKNSAVLPAALDLDVNQVLSFTLSYSKGNDVEKIVLITANAESLSPPNRRSLLVCDVESFLDETAFGSYRSSSADVMLDKTSGVTDILRNPSLGLPPLESAINPLYGGYNKSDFSLRTVNGIEVFVGGRYFTRRNEYLHETHSLTRALLHGKSSFYPERLLSALASEIRKTIKVGCYLTIVPSKPGNWQRMELMLDQLKPFLAGERINFVPDVFKYAKNFETKAQGGREDRIKVVSQNLCVKRKPIQSSRVIVIDDIITTGATLEVSQRLLVESGVNDMVFLVLGQTHA